MVTVQQFSELVGALYATTLRQQEWGRFLDLLCLHTKSQSSFLLIAGCRQGLAVQAQGGKPFEQAVLDDYAANYAMQDPYRLPMLRCGRTGLIDCNTLLPPETARASDMFRHLNAPAGLYHPGLMLFTCTVRRLEAISLWRSEAEGPMNEEVNRLLELLIPHIRAALEMRQVLGVAQRRLMGAEAMADASATATFLVSHAGELLHANAAARALLEQGDGLRLAGGYLEAAVPAMRKPLLGSLRMASAKGRRVAAIQPAQALAVERTAGRTPLHLLASPVPPGAGLGQDGDCVLLLATDRDRPVEMQDEALRTYYGLTEAETEVVNGLLTGYSLEEVALVRKVAMGTVRSQLKAIFAKTGTQRQSDLVRLMLSLPRAAERM